MDVRSGNIGTRTKHPKGRSKSRRERISTLGHALNLAALNAATADDSLLIDHVARRRRISMKHWTARAAASIERQERESLPKIELPMIEHLG